MTLFVHTSQRMTLLLTLMLTAALGVFGHQRVFYTFDASDGLAANGSQTLTCTKTGRMVICTIGHINFYDGSTFSHIDPVQDNVYALPKYDGHYHMYFDKHHHLWLKDRYQVTCVDLLSERFVKDVQAVVSELGMKGAADNMFGDASNRVWFLKGRKLWCADLQKDMPVRLADGLQDMETSGDSLLMEFFADGLMAVYDLRDGRHLYDSRPYSQDECSRYDKSSVVFMHEGGFYQIRNGDKEGVLLHYDIGLRRWTTVMQPPYHLNNMAYNGGLLYIACDKGYWTYDPATGHQEHYGVLTLTGGRRLETDINALAFDRQGGLWAGTERRGLLYSKPYRSPFTVLPWSDPEAGRLSDLMDRELKSKPLPRRVNCIYTDSRGWTWMGTYAGLKLLQGKAGREQVLTQRDGLANEMIHAIVEDEHHDIWVSTSYGISQLTIKDGKVYHIESYTDRDNVPNESFVNGRAIRLADGTIAMQALDFMLTFKPEGFYLDSLRNFKLYPKLIRLMVNGNYVKAGMEVDGRVILDRAITRIREFSVNYDQNSLSLTFSGLNYMRPIQTYYRYRVKGLFNDWRVLSHAESGGQVDDNGLLHMTLVGLRPGHYEVELQASMMPDYWPQEPFVWGINVEEPWWRTTGVYMLLGVLLLAVAVANGVYFNRNMRRRFMLNNAESDLLKRLHNYIDRCELFMNDVLTPHTMQVEENAHGQTELNREFVEAMVKIVPYVKAHRHQHLSMMQLAGVAGIKSGQLYELIADNIYRSPRQLAERLRLQQAALLLKTKDMEVEAIADQCGFVSPNYFIACFYHHYRQTPDDYRRPSA